MTVHLDRRLLLVAGVGVTLAFVVVLIWPYLVAAGVLSVAWRVIGRDARRRRPKSSWSSLGRTGALMYAAWNSRWLKPSSPVRAKVHASADGGDAMLELKPAPADSDDIPF